MKIVILDGPMKGRQFPLSSFPIVLGRKSDADISLAQDPRVSRVHCQIVRDDKTIWLEDLGSTNGTFKGADRVADRIALRARDTFRVGDTELCLLEEGDTDLPPPYLRTEPVVQEPTTRRARIPESKTPITEGSGRERQVQVTGVLDPRRLGAPTGEDSERIARLERRLELYHKVSRTLAGKLELGPFLQAVADSILDALPAERLSILMVGPDGEIKPAVSRRRGEEGRQEAGEPQAFSRSILERTLGDQVAVLLHDTLSDEQLRGRHSIALGSIRSAMCVPLIQGGAVKAVIYLDAPSARAFTQEDLETVTAISNQASLALANAELYEELKGAYDDLREAQERLVQSEKLSTIGTLAASIAHDVGNVLTPISAISSKVLESANLESRLREMFERQIRNLRALTQQLLSFSRQRPPKMEPLDLNEALRQSVALVETEARHRGVEMEMEPAADLPRVRADGSRLDQVFINLILNAVQAMEPAGGGTLMLRTFVRDDMVAASFLDSGPGMTPEVLDKIFRPFFSTKGDKGTGLGLFSCRRIVESEHGGRLEVESRPGEGTTFTVLLPRT